MTFEQDFFIIRR